MTSSQKKKEKRYFFYAKILEIISSEKITIPKIERILKIISYFAGHKQASLISLLKRQKRVNKNINIL